ncbi:MAG: T9SS type A sorting domain-containing protein [Cytophagaceae bacterium]
MKRLILFASAIMLSLSSASAQGWQNTGAHDDFASSTQYSTEAGQGLYWFDLTGGTTIVLSRPGNGAMNIQANNAGGCNSGGTCYPGFGVSFGEDNGTPYLLNLASGADIKIDVENMSGAETFIAIELEDVNGKKAKFEPNVSDITPSSTWDDVKHRKSLIGFTLMANDRKTVTIDLSSLAAHMGGLSQNGDYNCDPGPYNCPPTSYQIDASKIKAILFLVNLGKDNIFVSEGKEDGDHTEDTFIPGSSITPFTGQIKFHDFRIGSSVVASAAKAMINNSLSVYPNPAKETFTLQFESLTSANVNMTDLVGNVVYTSTANAGANQLAVNTSDLPAGIYLLNISTENGVVARKVVIQ